MEWETKAVRCRWCRRVLFTYEEDTVVLARRNFELGAAGEVLWGPWVSDPRGGEFRTENVRCGRCGRPQADGDLWEGAREVR